MADQPADRSRSRSDFDLYVAVAIGGVIGAFSRHGLDLLIPVARDSWPTATFTVNISGAFILGVILVIAREAVPDPKSSSVARRFRPFLVTGVLGGYTTFSTFMVESHGLVATGHAPMALLYIFGSLVTGVLAVALGLLFAGLAADAIARPSEVVVTEAEQELRETTEDEG